jgi:hypothetical protein
LDIGSAFSADFFEQHIVLLSKISTLFLADLSFVHIDFVAEHGDDGALASLVLDIVDPPLHSLEGGPVGHIVHNDSHRRVADVVGDERAEAFLAGGVPQLQSYGFFFQEDIL